MKFYDLKNFVHVIIVILISVLPGHSLTPPTLSQKGLPRDILKKLANNPEFYSFPGRIFPSTLNTFKADRQTTTADEGKLLYLPVLCARYADMDTGLVSITLLQQKLFGDWETGSMRDYYLENSYQQFLVDGQVHGWYTLGQPESFYDRENQHIGELLTELLTAMDDSLDFSQFDNDGQDNIPDSGDDDSYVDVVAIVHSGYGAEETGGPEIWSHFSRYSYYTGEIFVTNDINIQGKNIKIDDFFIVPARQYDRDVEIGVFCHELGHALGLPDLYDKDYSSKGIGTWCIMSGGAWGGNFRSPQTPTHFSAWCKERLGWVQPVIVSGNVNNLTFPPVEDQPVVYKLWKHGEFDHVVYENNEGYSADVEKEYFILENRQRIGFDANLPGEGLLIWHIDHSVPVRWSNDKEESKLVDLEAADGLADLDYNVNYGDAGDPFPGVSGNHFFNRYSNPSSQSNDLSTSKTAVYNIQQDGDLIIADLDAVTSDLVVTGYDITGKSDLENIFAPGDDHHFYIKLTNYGLKVDQVTGVLHSNDIWISIPDSTGTWEQIEEDQTAKNLYDLFNISVSVNAPPHTIKCTLELETLDGFTTTLPVEFDMEKNLILLVDDSGDDTDANGVPVLKYYTDALDHNPAMQYDVWSVEKLQNPTRYDMWEYNIIIWFTGSKAFTLSQVEMANFRNIMYLGGKVFLSGQYIGRHLLSEPDALYRGFYEEWLHAREPEPAMVIDADNLSLKNYPENAVFDQIPRMSINNVQETEVVLPDSLAFTALEYVDDESGSSPAAICYDGNYRSVFFAFGLESIGAEESGAQQRALLMQNVISWMKSTGNLSAIAAYENKSKSPSRFKLHYNYPNPFNAETRIHFELFEPAHISLTIYNVSGRKIITLAETRYPAGKYNIGWNGTDIYGNKVASGLYFYLMETAGMTEIKKMILIK